MLQTLKFGRKIYYGLQKTIYQKRLFLTEAYRCEEAWNRRLDSPILKDIKVSNMIYDLGNKYSSEGKVSAVDIDIVANIVSENSHVEDMISMIRNLRNTSEATNILDSTHHAFIRFLLGCNRTDELLTILHDRLNYGIFPDNLCYNILMDTFIKKGEYANAAKVAVLPMLQEEYEHPITNALSVYSCHMYLENPKGWVKPEPPVDDSEEEIKIRVAYIRNPYFDDHFDLIDPRDLVGKTLAFHGKHIKDVLGRTCQLRGLILYKKYEEVLKLIKEWLEESKDGNIVYEEVFDLIKHDNSHIPEDQITEEYKAVQSQLDTLKSANVYKGNLINTLESNIKSAVTNQAEEDISEQCKIYTKWENTRVTVLDMQLKDIERRSKLAEIEKMKKQLQEREELLTFFENEEEIELKIEEIELREKKEMERISKIPKSAKKLKKLEEAEVYIPPSV